MDPLILPGRVLDSLATLLTKWIGERAALSNTQAKRDMEQGWAREDRRAERQRKTLEELLEVLSALTRSIGQIHHHYTMVFQQTKVWGRTPLSEDLVRQEHEGRVRLNKLMVMVGDDELRAVLDRFRRSLSELAVSRSQVQAERALRDSLATFEAANARLGEVLRNLD